MNDLDRKVAQILIEELEERYPGTRWVARPSTPEERQAAQQRRERIDDERGEVGDAT